MKTFNENISLDFKTRENLYEQINFLLCHLQSKKTLLIQVYSSEFRVYML